MRCGVVPLPAAFIPALHLCLKDRQKELPAGGVLDVRSLQQVRSGRALAACFSVKVCSKDRHSAPAREVDHIVCRKGGYSCQFGTRFL